MIVGRVVQGIGGGLIPLAFGIIRDEFPQERVAGAVGLISALTAVGVGLGLVLAGPIVDNLSYRWLFWSPMALLAVATAAAFFVLPESPERVAGRVNWLAAGLLCGFLVALLLPISEAPVWGWGSPRVAGLLVLSAVLAAAWVAVERHAAQPLIDLRMMRIPVVWTAGLVALLLGVGMYAVFAFLPQMLQTPPSAGYGFGASITQSGLLLLPNCIASFIVGALCGRLTLRHGGRKLLVIGNAVGVIAFLMLVFARSQEWEIGIARDSYGSWFRIGVRRHVESDRPGRPPEPDRGRKRNEHQHPHHRGVYRRGSHDQHRRQHRARPSISHKCRLHPRFSLAHLRCVGGDGGQRVRSEGAPSASSRRHGSARL